MTLPTLLAIIIIGISFILVFKKQFKNVSFSSNNDDIKIKNISNEEKSAIIGLVILLWITEPFHSINSAIIALLETFTMFALKIIGTKNFKSLNLDLLIFLTADFAIGSVMNQGGIVNVIYSKIIVFFPATYSNAY